MLFSCSTNAIGRVFAWEGLNEIIDENYTTSDNFDPLSHLVLQFIYGDFHVSMIENHDIKEFISSLPEGTIDRSSPWLQYALMHLLKLSLSVVMATTTTTDSSITISLPKWRSDDVAQDDHERNRILYKVCDEEAHSRRNIESSYIATHISLRPVSSLSLEEVEAYWLKACKVMSSLVDANTAISSRAVFCLNALIEGGKDSALPSRIWSTLLVDLIDKLPLTITRPPAKPVADTVRDGMCLQCCNLIFDLIVNHVRELQQNTDFTSIWLKFIRTLTENLVLLGDQAGNIHSKMMEMIVTSLKLLVSAINIRLVQSTSRSSDVLSSSSSTQDSDVLSNTAPAPEGLFQFVTELLGFSGSPLPEPKTLSVTDSAKSTRSTPHHPSRPANIGYGSVPELTATAMDLSQSSRFSTPTKPQRESAIVQTSKTNRSEVNEVDSIALTMVSDQTLLSLTWKTIIANYRDFPVHLRSIYPHLMDELDKLVLASHDSAESTQSI